MIDSSDAPRGVKSPWDDETELGYLDGRDDASAADRRSGRALRRFASDIDRATTASQTSAATHRLLARLARARTTRAERDDD